jgi:hypothetical protein
LFPLAADQGQLFDSFAYFFRVPLHRLLFNLLLLFILISRLLAWISPDLSLDGFALFISTLKKSKREMYASMRIRINQTLTLNLPLLSSLTTFSLPKKDFL